jgi:hypothetical protein
MLDLQTAQFLQIANDAMSMLLRHCQDIMAMCDLWLDWANFWDEPIDTEASCSA